MNDKIKKIIIPFILMLIFNLGSYYLSAGDNFAEGLSPHVGILLISGLIFGPYGAIGSVIGNFLCDLIRGYTPIVSVLSAAISFSISYLGYKLWYVTYKSRITVTNPKLNNTNNVLLFLSIVLLCGALYSILHGKLFYLFIPETIPLNSIIEIRYFLNFINASFIFGIVGIWISNKINLFHIPIESENKTDSFNTPKESKNKTDSFNTPKESKNKTDSFNTPKESENKTNERFYKITGILLLLSLLLTLIIDCSIRLNKLIVIVELIVICLVLAIYLKKPIESRIILNDSKSITEDIMNLFHLSILFIVILGIIISYDQIVLTSIDNVLPLNSHEIMITMMALIDILLFIFFIPSVAVLKYIEMKVIEPILSFSKIEDFIHENEKIESDRLVEIYSKYVDEETEIGTLARSYSDLIKFNNNYIENIREIEGEKERIKAELNIATRIQSANLPTEAIVNENYIVNGYSKPAKEVGGDFFDYYELDDDHLAIVIGDASGKGVPAAILAMITQVMIKQLLKHNQDPSRVLYLLNNQLCENNSESMFITLWLGIYNKTTKELIFSNGGHEPPLIKENNMFKPLTIESGLVLGLMEDFEYITEEIILSDEIVLYTDGISDANNNENEMYGQDKLLEFFNDFKSDRDPIRSLLKNISKFTQDAEQFDDMTLLYLKIKND